MKHQNKSSTYSKESRRFKSSRPDEEFSEKDAGSKGLNSGRLPLCNRERTPISVAALYIDPKGPYPKMAGVDCWDEVRDAKRYSGPWPVVAHPPCGPWGALRHMRVPNRERRQHDAECGPVAFDQVRRFGGVLEQPAGSKLFDECKAPRPGFMFHDDADGYSLEVEQVSWGHVARKRTWLYCVGVDRYLALSTLRSGGNPTHWVSGGRKHERKGRGGVVPPGIKVCSAQQRRRTPPLFAEWLIELARSAART